MAMKYRLAVFDSDGTLADTLPWMRSVFNELADEYGFRRVEAFEQDRFRDLHGRELLAALQLPIWKLPRVVAAMRRKMAGNIGTLNTFPGVGAMLQQLHAAGLQLGIVSSNARENVERILGPSAAGLIAHYDCGASMFGKAVHIRSVVRASGVPPAQCIYIGDEIRDGEAARKVGVAFGAVAWGQNSLPALQTQKPVVVFHSVSDIAAFLCPP
jgi:phosphoglycolate phosphatase